MPIFAHLIMRFHIHIERKKSLRLRFAVFFLFEQK